MATTLDECIQWGDAEPNAGHCDSKGVRCSVHSGQRQKREPTEKMTGDPMAPGDVPVSEIDGCTVCNRGVILEGVLALRCVLRDGDSTRYRMQVRRMDGTVDVADMKPEVMESAQLWNGWLADKANVNGRINKHTRQALKDHVFSSVKNAPQTTVLRHAGWNAKTSTMVFANGFIDARGCIRRSVDEFSGLEVEVAGGARQDMVLDTGANREAPRLPAVLPAEWAAEPVPAPARDEAAKTMEAFLQVGFENYGNHALSIAMGYMVAHVASDALHAEWHRFPHLYVTGPYQTGKDTLARLAMTALMGNPHGALKGSGNTPKEIRNALGRSSFHPLWVNELRGGLDEKYLEGFIRAGYDRQSSATTNIRQERVEFPVLRSFLLVGETVMGGGAELSRYVEVVTRPAAKPEMLYVVEEMLPMVQQAVLALLSDFQQFRAAILDRVKDARAVLLGEGMDERRAYGWAVVCAGMSAMLRTVDGWSSLPQSFQLEVLRRAKTSMSRSDDAGVLARAWDWVMPVRESITGNAQRWIWVQNSHLYISPSRLFAVAGQHARSAPPNIDLLRNEFARSPAYVNWVQATPNKASGRTPAFQFDLTHPDIDNVFPEWVLEIAHRDTKTGTINILELEKFQGRRIEKRAGEQQT